MAVVGLAGVQIHVGYPLLDWVNVSFFASGIYIYNFAILRAFSPMLQQSVPHRG